MPATNKTKTTRQLNTVELLLLFLSLLFCWGCTPSHDEKVTSPPAIKKTKTHNLKKENSTLRGIDANSKRSFGNETDQRIESKHSEIGPFVSRQKHHSDTVVTFRLEDTCTLVRTSKNKVFTDGNLRIQIQVPTNLNTDLNRDMVETYLTLVINGINDQVLDWNRGKFDSWILSHIPPYGTPRTQSVLPSDKIITWHYVINLRALMGSAFKVGWYHANFKHCLTMNDEGFELFITDDQFVTDDSAKYIQTTSYVQQPFHEILKRNSAEIDASPCLWKESPFNLNMLTKGLSSTNLAEVAVGTVFLDVKAQLMCLWQHKPVFTCDETENEEQYLYRIQKLLRRAQNRLELVGRKKTMLHAKGFWNLLIEGQDINETFESVQKDPLIVALKHGELEFKFKVNKQDKKLVFDVKTKKTRHKPLNCPKPSRENCPPKGSPLKLNELHCLQH